MGLSVSNVGIGGQILFGLEMAIIDVYDLVQKVYGGNGSHRPANSEGPKDFSLHMIPGFEKIVEQRIREAQKKGDFDHLQGRGEPLDLAGDATVPEDLRMAHKVLKNADCLPPEIELKKEIRKTEDLLAGMTDTAEKYRTLKKLNFMIMRLNTLRNGPAEFDVPQHYSVKLVDRLESNRSDGGAQ